MLTKWYECLLQLMRMEFVSWERSISLCPMESQQWSNAAWRLLAGRQTASSQSRQKTVKSTASVMTPYIQFYSFWAYCLLKQYLVRYRYSGIPYAHSYKHPLILSQCYFANTSYKETRKMENSPCETWWFI